MSINTPAELRTFATIPASVSDATLQLSLDMASLIVTEDMATCTMSADRSKLIELNLAAHFAPKGAGGAGTGILTGIKVGESEERYAAMTSKTYGLSTSMYGQQAIALDPCGILVSLAASPLKAQFKVYNHGGVVEG